MRVEFTAHEVTCDHVIYADDTEDHRPQYTRRGSTSSDDEDTFDVADAVVYCGGAIKFDGCAEVTFEDHLHLCGRGCWQAHVDLMAWIWRRAGELLGPDNSCADEFRPLDPPAATAAP